MRCKEIYENLEKNLDMLRKCSKDDSIISRVQHFLDFCKKYDIDYGLVSEGAVRPLIVKENKNQDITKEVEGIKKILASQGETKEKIVKDAEKTCDFYEMVQKNRKLSKVEKKEYDIARHTKQTNEVPDIDRITRKQVQTFMKTVAKSVPNGMETLTLSFAKDQYDAINSHFNEGNEAINKKALAKEVVGFLFQAISKKPKVNHGV